MRSALPKGLRDERVVLDSIGPKDLQSPSVASRSLDPVKVPFTRVNFCLAP